MLKEKQRFLLKSFRFKVLLIAILVLFIGGLYLLITHLKNRQSSDNSNSSLTEQQSSDLSSFKVAYMELRSKTDHDIDSIMYNFGIKKDWISTSFPDDKSAKLKRESQNVLWFVKSVQVPKDVNSAQLNLDLTSYIRYLGLKDSVMEDIKTTNLVIFISSTDDTSETGIPLAKIYIEHSDKVTRESCNFVIILNIQKYKHDSNTDYLLTNSNEFSYLFPRNPDEIELQNKLIQLKKDVILNLVLGKEDNLDADFNPSMDDKELKQKVRSLILDYPYIRTYILSKPDSVLKSISIYSEINAEFQKYSGILIADSSISKLLSRNEDESKNKVDLIIERLRSKIGSSSTIITILTIPDDALKDFYDKIITLKKLGCRFYTYCQNLEKQKQIQKKLADKTDMNISPTNSDKNKPQKKNTQTPPKKNKK